MSKIPNLFMPFTSGFKLALPWFNKANIMPDPAVSTKLTPIKRLKSYPARQKLFCKSRKIETLVPISKPVIKNRGNSGDLEIV